MASTFSGRVWKFGDDINTDLIIPGYALFMPPEEQRRQCFSANRPGWVDEVRPGDVLIAGRNFGVGSARAIGDIFRGLRNGGHRGRVVQRTRSAQLRQRRHAGSPLRRRQRPLRGGRRGDRGLALGACGEHDQGHEHRGCSSASGSPGHRRSRGSGGHAPQGGISRSGE